MSFEANPAMHPDEIVTASYLDGTLPDRERARFEGHLAACQSCRDGVVLLKTAGIGTNEDDAYGAVVPAEFLAQARGAAVASTAPVSTTGAAWKLAAAAAILLAVSLAFWRPWRDEPQAKYRGETVESFGSVTPGTGAIVSAEELVFVWQAVPGADRYEVELLSSTGESVFTTAVGARQLSARWPRDRAWPDAGPLMWKVRARALDRVLAETRPIPFEVR